MLPLRAPFTKGYDPELNNVPAPKFPQDTMGMTLHH